MFLSKTLKYSLLLSFNTLCFTQFLNEGHIFLKLYLQGNNSFLLQETLY